jgi:hypothetical protein
MKKRLYVKFETGDRWFWDATWFETYQDAVTYCKEKGYHGIYSIRRYDGSTVDGSGWKPHYNLGLGQWVETRGEYNRILKEKNLIELGTEKIDPLKYNEALNKKYTGGYITDDLIDYCRETGNTLDDNTVKELRNDGL